VPQTLGGTVYWTSHDMLATRQVSISMNLLPSFDEFLVAYKDRSA
jgi:hypothetical protein